MRSVMVTSPPFANTSIDDRSTNTRTPTGREVSTGAFSMLGNALLNPTFPERVRSRLICPEIGRRFAPGVLPVAHPAEPDSSPRSSVERHCRVEVPAIVDPLRYARVAFGVELVAVELAHEVLAPRTTRDATRVQVHDE